MSYLVLARKYRPQTFADVVGQNHVIRPLINALKSGRLAHAYLFSGARGTGKTTVARLLAMALNCQAEPQVRPCSECDSCQEIMEGQAVDVFEIDGASNRGINEIRDLRETIKYLPSKGRHKVYIIDEVHMLTKEAFNALLKTLEEPPAHVVFVFATTEAHKVLPTILSRCQRYDFKRISPQDIVGRLEEIAGLEAIEISPSALRSLARQAEGGLRDALSLFDQVIAFAGASISDDDLSEALGLIDQALLGEMAVALLNGDAGTALGLLEKVYNFGHDLKEFASQMLNYFRALVVTRVSRKPAEILDLLESETGQLQEIGGRVGLETLNFHFQAWLDVQGSLQRSTQPRLVLEALLIRLAQVEPLEPLAELTSRLESLLEGAGPQVPAPPPDPGSYSGSRPSSSDRAVTHRRESTLAEPKSRPEMPPAEKTEARPEQPSAAAGTSGDYSWDDFAALVRKTSPLQLAPLVSQCQVRGFGPDLVELVFGNKQLTDLMDQEKLTDLLKEFFGRQPQVRIRYEAEAEALMAETKAEQEKSQKKAEDEILNHPLVKDAQELFSGEVIEIIPEAEPGPV